MKKIVLLSIILMAGVSAFAQWRFATVAGVYYNFVDNISPKTSDNQFTPGFQAGLLSEFKFTPTLRKRRIGIQTSLLLVRKKIGVQAEYLDSRGGVANYVVTQTAFSNFMALSAIATLHKIYDNGEVYAGLGSAYYQSVSGRPGVKDIQSSESNEGIKFKKVIRQDYQPHFSVRLEAGFRLNCGFSYRILIEGGLGKNSTEYRPASAVSFGVGYFFR